MWEAKPGSEIFISTVLEIESLAISKVNYCLWTGVLLMCLFMLCKGRLGDMIKYNRLRKN